MGNGIENPPELTEEDERLLDLAWKAVREWKQQPIRTEKSEAPVRLGWGLNK